MLYGNNISWNYFCRFSFRIFLPRAAASVCGAADCDAFHSMLHQCTKRHGRVFPFACSIFFAWLKLYTALCGNVASQTWKAIKMICYIARRSCTRRVVASPCESEMVRVCVVCALARLALTSRECGCAFVATRAISTSQVFHFASILTASRLLHFENGQKRRDVCINIS